MNNLGIYFGPNSINITETKAKKLINHIQMPFSQSDGADLEEKVPLEIKLVALINDVLRRNKIEVKEAFLSLSGRDLIIRSFEMPELPKDEMAQAIRFEARKYIPFKIEDIISDYQSLSEKATRINNILFVGIKKESLDRYLSVFSQVNIKLTRIEYSGFGLIRALKLSGIRDTGVVGTICADFNGGDEVNFIVSENGFPLFNRDISLNPLTGLPAGIEGPESQSLPSFDKLKAEIRTSLEYYQRKFPGKNIQRIYSFVNPEHYQEVESFMQELSILSKFVDIAKVISRPEGYSTGLLKSFSASLANVVPTSIKINLVETKTRPAKVALPALKIDFKSLLKDVNISPRIIFAGLLICIVTSVYGVFRMIPLRKELNTLLGSMTRVSGISEKMSSTQLRELSSNYKKRLTRLDAVIRKQFYATEALNSIPFSIPEGVWLTKFSLEKVDPNKMLLVLEGRSYLKSGDKEIEIVNKFADNLKRDPALAKYFTDINVTSINQENQGRIVVTRFVLTCKNYKEAR